MDRIKFNLQYKSLDCSADNHDRLGLAVRVEGLLSPLGEGIPGCLSAWMLTIRIVFEFYIARIFSLYCILISFISTHSIMPPSTPLNRQTANAKGVTNLVTIHHVIKDPLAPAD
jgi:hypothetical protein